MKLSLSWLFDHIDADWRTINVPALVSLFNKTTAEIEGFQKLTIDLKKLAAATVKEINNQKAVVEAPEWQHTIDMPLRDGVAPGQIYLIAKEKDTYIWAKLTHLGSEKEGLIPALSIAQKELDGTWKKTIEEHDVILHLDNKSVNHRPDMWGHRGVALEVAAMLKLPFKALDHNMLIRHDVKEFGNKKEAQADISITVENPEACRRFAGLYFSEIKAQPTSIWMAAHLAKVDSRPINAIVDATNYVMLDISQPMHAFDAATFSKKSIVVRQAKNKETLALLDGQTVELTNQDCIIADGQKPVALAGIMGGKDSGVNDATNAIILESANFDPAAIRKTAMHVKKRTESSARFEKDLDPNQNIIAIERFLKLLDDMGVSYKASDYILSLGDLAKQKVITISHSYIEQLLGVTIAPDFVIQTLEKLEFAVEQKKDSYHIVVPSFRATKDINIKQDIVEEIGRFYGYETITETLPARQTKPFDLTDVDRMRRIKQLLAYSLNMHELYTYAFFDESFLNVIGWQPTKTLKVQEAVSENWQRLVTTLIPNLFKAVHVHAQEFDQLNFFEMARIWPEGAAASERSCLSGIFVDQKKPIDFYDGKQKLCKLAQLLGIHFEWIQAPSEELQPWYLQYQTAYLLCDGVKIGIAGKVNPAFFHKIAAGDAFIFEFDAHFLLLHHVAIKRYMQPSKYPGINRDVSMLISTSTTVKSLRDALKKIDEKIVDVALLDFFEKPEWHDQKSLTFRITLSDPAATMNNTQADAIMHKVNEYLQKQGAVIR